MDLKAILSLLLPSLGKLGVEELVKELEDIANKAEAGAWEKDVLLLVADMIEKNGPQGLDLAIDWLTGLMSDSSDEPVDFTGMDPLIASNLLAKLQNAEADEKSAVSDFLGQLGDSLGKIISGLIKGLF